MNMVSLLHEQKALPVLWR